MGFLSAMKLLLYEGEQTTCCKVSEHLLIYHSSDVEVVTSVEAGMIILIMDE